MKKLLLFVSLPFLAMGQVQIGTNINGEAAGDTFANALCLSADGTVLAVGANLNDGNGPDSGHVRVFKNISGTWTQIGADIDGSAAGDYSGLSISLSSDGSVLAVGSPRNYGFSGQMRIFRNISGNWTPEGTIQGATFGDNWGFSVSLSADGGTLATGGIGKYTNGLMTGGVKVYKNIMGVWTPEGNDIDGHIGSNSFGRCVKLSSDGNKLAISEPYTTVNGAYSGRVRIYENIAGTWTQIGNPIDGTYANGIFGYGMSFSGSGNIIAIGAPGAITGGSNSGQVKVFEFSSGNWTLKGNAMNGSGIVNSAFGNSLSLSSDGNVLIVGSNNFVDVTTNPGRAQIFKYESGNWIQKGNDINGSNSELLGSGVAISGDGNTVATGAMYNADNGVNAGQAKVFDISSLLTSDDFVFRNFSVFPNPASGNVSVTFQNGLELEELTLYNNLGQLIRSMKTETLNVTDLAQGVYFLQAVTNKGKAIKRIIVE